MEAILTGAVLGVLGGAAFIGLNHLLSVWTDRRAPRHGFASGLERRVRAVQVAIFDQSRAGELPASVLEDAESMLLLSPVFLSSRDAGRIANFHNASKHYIDALESWTNTRKGKVTRRSPAKRELSPAPDPSGVFESGRTALASLHRY
jgi:hypothetical protein